MIRIIGIGSWFDDDAIGWQCLDTLKPGLLALPIPVEILYCASPGTQLIHQLQATDTTLLVDALQDDNQVARVVPVDAGDLQDADALSSHDISVAHVLQLAASLKRLPARLHILGIGIDIDRPLSVAQRQSVTLQLMEQINGIIGKPGT